jgi:hypothetical protein
VHRKATSEEGTWESDVNGRMVARVLPSRRVTCVGEKSGDVWIRRIGGDVGSSSIAGMVFDVLMGGYDERCNCV